MKNITFKSKLNLFNNYTDPVAENRANIDVNWENSLNLTVNEYITVNIYSQMIYDHDILIQLFKDVDGVEVSDGVGRRLQIKQTLGLGFSYKF